MKRRVRPIFVLVTSLFSTIAVLLPYGFSGNAGAQTSAYLLTFPWEPSSPLSYNPPDVDLAVHSRDQNTWNTLEPMLAQHDDSCNPPPATHTSSSYEGALFVCHMHLMSAINAGGYGLIYVTPSAMLDFTNGEAAIDFDMSTLRSSTRDWVDLWVTPFSENLELPLEPIFPDLNGVPQDAVHVRMDNNGSGSIFGASVISNFDSQDLDNLWWVPYESFLVPSATRRDTFELRLSRTHVKFGMPQYNFWWVDADIPDLGWGQGVVQFGHHSYTPQKACDYNGTCGPNTWHWDNIRINPSLPFTIIRSDQRWVDATTPADVTFSAPAPAGAFLRFAGAGANVQLSFDGGQSWQSAVIQPEEDPDPTKFQSYWTPVPAGVSALQISAQDTPDFAWRARDFSIWAPPGAAPSSSQAASNATQPPPHSARTAPSQARPTTAHPAASVASNHRVNVPPPPSFVSRSPITTTTPGGVGRASLLSNPIGWFLNNPLGQFTISRLSSNGWGIAQGTFKFVVPARVISVTAQNTGTVPSKVTLQCKGQHHTHRWVPAGGMTTINTGWTGTCASFTASSTNSWATVLDNLLVSPT